MKILHVLASNTYNGAENVACQIIDMHRDDPNYDMVYCSPDGAIRKALEKRDVPYVPISALTPKEIKRVIDEVQPDIIHAHDRKASLVCAMVKRKARLISHIHNNPDGAKRLSLEAVGYLPAARSAERIVWVSQDAYEDYYFRNQFENKSIVLKNIISAENVLKAAEEDPREYDYDVIFVGRMVYQKNPERFVELIKQLSKDTPDIKAAMVGTGDLEETVKKHISDLEMTGTIDYIGYMDNPYKLIKCSKVLLLPSRWEGLPMVQLEAEALGTYVVRTPGTDEELVDRVKKCLLMKKPEPIDEAAYKEYKMRLDSIYAGENS